MAYSNPQNGKNYSFLQPSSQNPYTNISNPNNNGGLIPPTAVLSVTQYQSPSTYTFGVNTQPSWMVTIPANGGDQTPYLTITDSAETGFVNIITSQGFFAYFGNSDTCSLKGDYNFRENLCYVYAIYAYSVYGTLDESCGMIC